MVGDNDWDLFAVVRSCNSSAPSSAARDDAFSCLASVCFNGDQNDDVVSFSDMVPSKQPNGFQELQQAYMSFLPSPVPAVPTAGAAARSGSSKFRPPPFMATVPHSHTPKVRKRKSQQKKTICHVTSDNLCTDMWAWRKYGQKPIKGSPYPRNYYRCSSSKGCGARKQVERSNSDPETFIVTYTGDHTHPRPTHRNSLAGSSRNRPIKIPSTGDPASDDVVPEGDDATPEDDDVVPESEDDEEDDLLIPNLTVRDEIFVGLEEVGGGQKP